MSSFHLHMLNDEINEEQTDSNSKIVHTHLNNT